MELLLWIVVSLVIGVVLVFDRMCRHKEIMSDKRKVRENPLMKSDGL